MKDRFTRALRWSERYLKTDMVYLAQAGFWVNLNIVIASIFGLLLSIAFANLLTPAVYGEYQFLLSLSVLIAAVSLAGMNGAVAQAVARGYEGTLRTAVRLQFKWAVVPVLAALVAATYYLANGNADIGAGLIGIALFTPLANVYNTYVGFLEGRRAFRSLFTFGTITNVVSYGSLFVAVLFAHDAAVLICVNLATNTASMAYAYYRTLRTFHPNEQVDPAALTYGKHASVMSAFTTIMSQVDSVLVFHFLGAAELAVYSLATMLPERIGTLFNFVGMASMPKFANQPVKDIRAHLPEKLLRIAVAGLVAAGLYAVFAPLIFALIFPKYHAAVPYTAAYAPIVALLALTSVTNAVLVAKRFTRETYILSFLQPVLLVGLQVPLLLAYGIWGMIIARLASDTIGIALGLTLTYRPFSKDPENVPLS